MKRRNSKIHWFFRSFTVTSVMLFCVLLLLLGVSEGYARMQSKITGETVMLIENKNNKIYILNKEICSAKFVDILKSK